MLTDGARFAIISVFIVFGVIMLGIGTSLTLKEDDDGSRVNEK